MSNHILGLLIENLVQNDENKSSCLSLPCDSSPFERPPCDFSISISEKESLQNFPSPITLSPITPSRFVDRKVWKKRCAILARQDHDEYSRYAAEIIDDLINTLPFKIEDIAKRTALEILNDKQDTRSVSSTEFTPSESKFDTAREELQNILPDLAKILYDRRDVERSDTDYESGNDNEDDSICPELFSKHFNFRNFNLDSCIITTVPKFLYNNKMFLSEDFDSEKTPIPTDLNTNENTSFDLKEKIAFDKEKISVDVDNISKSPNLNLPTEYFDNIQKGNVDVKSITNFNQQYSASLPSICVNDTSDSLSKFEEVEPSVNWVSPFLCSSLRENLRPHVEILNSSLSFISPVGSDSGSETEISATSSNSKILIFNSELEHVTSDGNSEEIINGTGYERLENEIDIKKKSMHSVTKSKTSESLDSSTSENEINKKMKPLSDAFVPERFVETFDADEDCRSNLSIKNNYSNDTKDLNSVTYNEYLDTSFGKIHWQPVINNNSLNDEILNPSGHESNILRDHLETDCEPEELQKLLALDAKLIAEELIKFSILSEGREPQTMKNKMVNIDNNEQSAPSDGDKEYDENVNPFESKPKLTASSRCNSRMADRQKELMKNGETDSKAPAGNTSHSPFLARSCPTSGSPNGKINDSRGLDSDCKGNRARDHISSAGSPSAYTSTTDQESRCRKPLSQVTPPKFSIDEMNLDSQLSMFQKDKVSPDGELLKCGKLLSDSALSSMSLYFKFDLLLKAISPISKYIGKEPSAGGICYSNETKYDLMKTFNSKEEQTDGIFEKLLTTLNGSQKLPQMNDSIQDVCLYSEEEICQALRLQEMLFQEQLLKKEKEWNERVKQLEEKQHQIISQFKKSKESQQQMGEIAIGYEKTISQLMSDRDKDKQETNELIVKLKKERDQALEDMQNVEKAFADLNRRNEKSKSAVESFRKNEEVLKNCVAEGHVKLKKHEQKYDILKHHAEEKLECVNQEVENLRRSMEAQTAVLRARMKITEIKNDSLEKSLEQKIKENADLTNICDELIAKFGQGNS